MPTNSTPAAPNAVDKGVSRFANLLVRNGAISTDEGHQLFTLVIAGTNILADRPKCPDELLAVDQFGHRAQQGWWAGEQQRGYARIFPSS